MYIRGVGGNQLIKRLSVASSGAVFLGWNYSQRGAVYQFLSGTPIASQLPEPQKIRHILERDFVFDSRHPEKAQTWVLSTLSHRDVVHFAFNMITFMSFGNILTALPTRYFSGLLLGSAFASTGSYLVEQRSKKRVGRAVGASGVVSGVLTATTMIMPRLPIMLFVVPMPLWVATAGYFFVDTYMMTSSKGSSIGHSAHIGGGVFGIAYYLLFLRRLRF